MQLPALDDDMMEPVFNNMEMHTANSTPNMPEYITVNPTTKKN